MEMCVDAATMENSIYSPQKIKIETLYDLLSEKAMALHSNTLAWKISWTEEAVVHGVAKSQTQLSNFTFHFHILEKEMATHSSFLAWRILGMGEPG